MNAWKRDIDPASKTEEVFFDNGDTLPAFFNVDSRDIKEGKKIGQGIWTVHEAEWLGRKVAVKKFVADSTFGNVSSTSREVNRMLSVRHPNVLKLLGFYLTTQKELVLDCTMIMELMDCDLESYIGRGPMSDDLVVYVFAEVARGMNHIHKRHCFHRDLKPQNILVKKSIVTGFHVDVKIADFGSSELLGGGDINRSAGTTGYKAPEQFDFESRFFPDKVDVFAFGALCFKILTGKEPYQSGKNVREVLNKLDRGAFSHRSLPVDVVEMIWECLDVSPELRPDFEKISGILDGAVLAIREKMGGPLAASTSASLHSKESMLEGFHGHDHLESILDSMGLTKDYGVHFIPYEELVVLQQIGLGADATIYKAEWKGILYALKVFLKDFSSHLGKNYLQTFPKLVHKNIVTFMGYSLTSDDEICILMELQAMDLAEALRLSRDKRKGVLDNEKRWFIVREIAEGMKYLHDQGVVHRDLKSANVVVSALGTNEMTVKLIDFSNHFPNDESNDEGRGTTKYIAPERLVRSSSRSRFRLDFKKGDIYSFGILCQEILVGVPAFQNMGQGEFIEGVRRGKRPPIPIGTSPEMKCLIRSCWNGDPLKRPNFSEICERLSSTKQSQAFCPKMLDSVTFCCRSSPNRSI